MVMWYLARGAGIAAFAAFSVATAMGAASSRRSASLDRRVIAQYVHRAAAVSGLVLLVVHIATLLADSYAKVGWLGALVPFASTYRPWQVALGVAAMYAMVAVAVTGVMRSRFARTPRATALWRRIHLAAYAGWAMSAWHFFVSGTDAGTWWARAVLVAGIAVVGAGIAARLTGATRHRDRPGGRLVGPQPPTRAPRSHDLVGASR